MARKHTILITGGGGMVGQQASFGIALSHTQLDILKPQSIERAIKKYKPTAILHLAAMTDMLACEQHPKVAYEVNVVGTGNIAQACAKHKLTLIYLSTCVVFDGKKSTAYSEKDVPNPLTTYGQTKWLGELLVQTLAPNHLIIRTGWLFGGGKNIDTKFVNRTFQKLLHNQEVVATYNRTGSPTYVPDLLDTVQKLLTNSTRGVVHVVNSKTASYFDVAKKIQKIGGFSASITPITSSAIESKEVRRGKQETLRSSHVKLRNWDNAIKNYIHILVKKD